MPKFEDRCREHCHLCGGGRWALPRLPAHLCRQALKGPWVCLGIIQRKLHFPHQSIPPGMRIYLDVLIMGHLPACPCKILMGKLLRPGPTFQPSSGALLCRGCLPPPPSLAVSGFCVPGGGQASLSLHLVAG